MMLENQQEGKWFWGVNMDGVYIDKAETLKELIDKYGTEGVIYGKIFVPENEKPPI